MFPSRKKGGHSPVKLQKTKEKLLTELSKTVKELQKHVLSSGCFEISKNDENALRLTFILEAIFLHGYLKASISVSGLFSKSSSSGILPSPDFWEVLRSSTHRDVLHQLTHLSHVTTLVGKCRAWLRLALNDGLMESYLQAILSDKKKLSQQYGPNAFLQDEEATSILLNHFLGLIELHFDLNYNTPSLNQWTVSALQMSGAWEPTSSTTSPLAQPSEVPRPLSFPRVVQPVIHTKSALPGSQVSTIQQEISPSEEVKRKSRVDHVVPSPLSPDHNQPVERKRLLDLLSEHRQENKENRNAVAIYENDGGPFTQDADTAPKPDTGGEQDSPPSPKGAVSSPVSRPTGNMLGMGSGWSSEFETEPVTQAPSQAPRDVTEPPPAKRVTSFHGILSDYPVDVSKKFVPSEFSEYRDEQEGSNDESELFSKDMPYLKKADFEVIGVSSSPEEEHLQKRTMELLSRINDIAREKGLNGQDYKCQGCSRPIGMIYGQYKVCAYDGSYYCYECHVDDEHVIPARIIHNWDFTKYKVAKRTKLFVMQIEEEPVFHIDEVNPTLYNVISEMNKAKNLRIQLQHLQGYVMTCRSSMIAEDVKRRMWPREYLWDDIHQYSLLDLIQVSSGQLKHHLKKIISFCKKHVYSCEVCSQKGFVCEICKNPKILYAFEANSTSQCPSCKAVFHKQCKTTDECPRCMRRRARRQRADHNPALTEEPDQSTIHSDL